MGIDLQEELKNKITEHNIENEHDPSKEDPEELLEGAVEAVAESSDAITDSKNFDVYCSLLKHSDAVPGTVMTKLLDSLTSGFQTETDATIRDAVTEDPRGNIRAQGCPRHSEGEETAPVPKAKPKRGRGAKTGRTGGRTAASKKNSEQWSWQDHIPNALGLICRILEKLPAQHVWPTSMEREAFIKCITLPVYDISTNESYMKVADIKKGVLRAICLSVNSHGQGSTASTKIMANLSFHEHLAEPMAECLAIVEDEYHHPELADEVLRDISAQKFSAQDTKGPRTFSKFLIRYSEVCPRHTLKQISLLLDQLDSEAYPMRIAIVEIIGNLIVHLDSNSGPVGSQENTQTTKQINGLYDFLIERMRDVTTYVRTKVLSVFTRLCELKNVYGRSRLHVTRIAITALEDKAAAVRKNAVVLLVKLITTHPWDRIHKGPLEMDVWEKEYEELLEKWAPYQEKLDKFNLADQASQVHGEEEEEEEEGEGDSDDEAEQEEAEAEEDHEPTTKQPKKSNKKVRGDDEMDVEEDGDENESDANDDAMSVDGEEGEPQSRPRKKGKSKKASKKTKRKPRQSQLNPDALEALRLMDEQEVKELRLTKKYYIEGMDFMRHIEEAMVVLCQLLGSTNKPEALEAIGFFQVAYQYKMRNAESGIKKMLHLIWQKDNSITSEDGKEIKGVRSRLLESYQMLYFDPIANLDARGQVSRIAKNMIELTYGATLAELTSLEEMMRTMMANDQIPSEVISKLWQIYTSNKLLPKPQRRGAIVILGMLALAKHNILSELDHVDTMLKVGLGALGRADLTLARYTCVALQRLNGSAKKVKGSLDDKTMRIEMDSAIFQKLNQVILRPCHSKDWFGLAEQVINTVYALGEHPDVFCNDLIKKLTHRAFTPAPQAESAKEDKENDPDAMDEDHPGDVSRADSQEPKATDLGDAFHLSQLLFVVGHVAIKHIVYLELVEREAKRQKDEAQAAEKKAAQAPGARGPSSKDGEELDQVAGNAEDEIGEHIQEIREHELLFGPESLLAVYGPILVYICGRPDKNPTLKAAATLSFSKFLCVSSQFCDEHHLLLFKILEKSDSANIRSNIAIALGDVAVSFSTIIDENSNELYRGLSDPDLVVKKNTLMVLTHLILNGMVKVKGQLGEMAKCVQDPDDRISDLAKLFFKELSTKDNAIYNNLPDVISHLSFGEHAVDEEMFQSTMSYIFTFIEKDKQTENVVEKLCQRFQLSEEPRQWRDIAYCLSLLNYKSDRSVKKLIEGHRFYGNKLHEPVVYERFTAILNKARAAKSKDKPDHELDEFGKLLEESKEAGTEEHDLAKRTKSAVKKRAKRPATRSTRKVKVEQTIEEDDDE
ncbi:non-SMC mitotic condensation complex subunit 1-domain-containing protein [Desarmillaria tabescens]|uniref:Condensin complex subunit 1 n=1 Tax=Armillaria tabescens TaxID=1929756 RepID=A0AA39JXW6_ARMTA|nr:non-SMC mitotic condensation complex subunit 1-domain-containing protein [Desarmillaria tabescens]KAK0449831.1 non-SMC mitotic condensation complex subunit 1-domain-containing protein [Desarmillaria tabescens]